MDEWEEEEAVDNDEKDELEEKGVEPVEADADVIVSETEGAAARVDEA